MASDDIAGAVALQRACFPPPFPEDLLWSADHLARHLQVFAEGQFVAIAGGKVVASCSNCIISDENWQAHRSWNETVGGPYLGNHDPEGTTLYGLDISIHPEWRRKGLMRALYDMRFQLVRRHPALKRYGTAVRIPDFGGYKIENPEATAEDYVKAVADEIASDRTLTPMLKVGLTVRGVITNYMEDLESHNSAAVLEWRPE